MEEGAACSRVGRGYPVEKAAALDSAVVALNSQHLGGGIGIPTMQKVMEFLASYGIRLG